MDDSGERRTGSSKSAERPTGRRRGDRIVGSSSAGQRVIEQVVAAAASQLPVQIHGPAGSGKKHAARAVHAWSDRSAGPLEVLAASGEPQALLGRELFGCAAGTYPSLPGAHPGALERAAGGTLLIDHAELLPGELLQALSKALVESHFQREGDAEPVPLTARVILVSEEPLAVSLLRDLPHHEIAVSSLAQREEDVLALATHFLGLHAEQMGLEPVGFTADARAALLAEAWPGNVRELSERVAQALRLSGRGAISAEALALSALPEEVPSFKDAKRAFERRYVTGLLRRCEGNISRAARLAKKDRKDFYDVIRRTGVDPADFR